jgi:formylglycine-generating enzyme required for sulfatase activity
MKSFILFIIIAFSNAGIVFADSTSGPDKSGPEMVIVPAGWFAFQNNYKAFIYLDTFQIDKYEITNDFYCRFLNSADPCGIHYSSNMEIARQGSEPKYRYAVKEGRGRYPVRFVSAYDAEAFAAWRSKVYGGTYSVPTEMQWEKAAGWDPVLKKMFTYGYHSDSIDKTWCNYNNSRPLPVGSFDGANGRKDAKGCYGCYDMSGNVWEWTSSPYDKISRVIRGGAFSSEEPEECRSTARGTSIPASRVENIGLRLVLNQKNAPAVPKNRK